MRKSKKELKKLTKMIKNNSKTQPLDLKENTTLNYLLKLFKGRAGWKYISISRPGSTFKDNASRCIVTVQIHKEPPVLNNDGKYISDNMQLLKCVKLHDSDFGGVVIDTKGCEYLGDTLTDMMTGNYSISNEGNQQTMICTPESMFSEVTAEEIDVASKFYMEELSKSIEETNKKFNDLSKYFQPTEDEEQDPELKKELAEIENTLGTMDITKPEDMKMQLEVMQSITSAVAENITDTKIVIDSLSEIPEHNE